MKSEEFENIKHTLPLSAGVYRFIDENDNILYVGKAKSLKKRILQYFVDSKTISSRIKLMILQVSRIEFTVLKNENDALILENSLIKQYKPKYNIRLKDDKTYPFITIKNENFPRVFFTRKYEKDGSEYLGPYTSIYLVKEIFNFIKSMFALRTCNLNLSEENIQKMKFKECLEYHIGNCKAPCINKQTENDYLTSINSIRKILKGDFKDLKLFLNAKMENFAENLEFEKAEKIKLKIQKLKDFESKSVIFNPAYKKMLIVNIYNSTKRKFINYLRVENGAIISTKSFEIESKLNESDIELLTHFVEMYISNEDDIEELILPFEINYILSKLKMVIPILGDKKRLLELSYLNARTYANTILTDPRFEKKKNEFFVLKEMQEILHLKDLPMHIECFDNSNIQGTSPVAACVVFKKGMPSKKDYRHFHIKTVSGPDDFASMREIVYRRYLYFVENNIALPNLIIIDGGKGQLSSAIESLKELNILNLVPIIGVAKKLEEIYFMNDPIPLYIDKKSPVLKLIQKLRDEAHRFGITFHRDVRSKNMIHSPLTNVDGLGKITIDKLLKKYKTLKNIKNADFKELENLIGRSKLEILNNFLNNYSEV